MAALARCPVKGIVHTSRALTERPPLKAAERDPFRTRATEPCSSLVSLLNIPKSMSRVHEMLEGVYKVKQVTETTLS